MIIAFLSQKGGVGKTTLAISVAACLVRTGHRVLLIDADKQGSASAWAGLREEPAFDVVSLARDNMSKEAVRLAAGYDHTVIDGPPHAEGVARSIIVAADYVAMPIEPSGLSVWAADLTVRQITEAKEFKTALECGFVVSRKIGNTVIGRDARALTAEHDVPVLEAEIWQRVAFAEAMTMGKTIFEWQPGGTAAREIEALTSEVLEYDR